ncbi:hypothetical protein LCGC14_1257680, partial [marine sediment metagenome]
MISGGQSSSVKTAKQQTQGSNMTITLDPAHEAMDIFEQEITQDVWKEKYRYKDEPHPFDSFKRVVKGIYKDDDPSRGEDALAFMKAGL